MKIGIDASRAFLENRTGTEEYSYHLIKNLLTMDTSGHQVFLYTRKNLNPDFKLPDNFVLRVIKSDFFWTQIGLSLEIAKNPIDVLFVPSHSIPVFHPEETVATVHGLECKYFPQCYSLKDRLFLELNTMFSVKWAKKIIAPSKNTKKDLMKFYDVDPDKVSVVYHGVDTENRGLDIENRYRSKERKDFNILFIGRLEKRKNLATLVGAYDKFRNLKPEIENYKLILAGSEGFGFKEIQKAIEESSYKKDIILKGYVSQEEKNKLYLDADVFVIPSLYEGFGLPVLEAMSHGVPVICSGNSSLPEVVGDAALLVDSFSIEEIYNAIAKIADNKNFRDDMIKKGYENAKKFSWKECALKTFDLIVDT